MAECLEILFHPGQVSSLEEISKDVESKRCN